MEVMKKIDLMNAFSDFLMVCYEASNASFNMAQLALDLCENDEQLERFDAIKGQYYDSKDKMRDKIEELQRLINAIPTT